MIIFLFKIMKLKTKIYRLNYIKSMMMSKINKTICKMIKNTILAQLKKKTLLKSPLKDNGKQKNWKEVIEVKIIMKLDFYRKKEIKIMNRNGHFFISLLKKCKRRVAWVLLRLVSSKKYSQKSLRRKSFIPKIKIIIFYLHLKNLIALINLIFQTKLMFQIYQSVLFQDLKQKINHKKILKL